MNKDFSHFKQLLEEEKTRLEGELSGVGKRVPGTKDDWEARPEDMAVDESDPIDRADKIEKFSENIAIETELEARLIEVTEALQRIEAGTYGVCKICDKEIEEGRLEANPAASTCMAHMNA